MLIPSCSERAVVSDLLPNRLGLQGVCLQLRVLQHCPAYPPQHLSRAEVTQFTNGRGWGGSCHGSAHFARTEVPAEGRGGG